MSTEENKSGDIGSVVKNSLKTGFGSIIGIFGKDEQKKAKQTASRNSTDLNQSHSENRLSMSMQVDQSFMQPLSNSSLEYQIRLAFAAYFKQPLDVERYLVNVGRVLVNERDKIA